MKPLFATVVIGWGLSLAPAFAGPPGDHKAGDVVIEPASFSTAGAGTVQCDLGTLYVPENRADPKSRIIGVGFARFRAVKPTGASPTFHLPGGPGDSFVMALTKGEPYKSLTEYLDLFRSVGDVVLIDQRGYSERGDVLTFSYRTRQPLDQPASLTRHTAAFIETSVQSNESAVRQRNLRLFEMNLGMGRMIGG